MIWYCISAQIYLKLNVAFSGALKLHKILLFLVFKIFLFLVFVARFKKPSRFHWLNTGKYYMYFETSWPHLRGDQAILETLEDLSGCFCVHMACNHNVYNVYKPYAAKHSIKIMVGGKMAWTQIKRVPSWTDVFLQVDTESSTKVIKDRPYWTQ